MSAKGPARKRASVRLAFDGEEHPPVTLEHGVVGIGSHPKNRVRLRLPGVSPFHAEVRVDPNGTSYIRRVEGFLHLNGWSVMKEEILKVGDIIDLDEVAIIVEAVAPTAAATEKTSSKPLVLVAAVLGAVVVGGGGWLYFGHPFAPALSGANASSASVAEPQGVVVAQAEDPSHVPAVDIGFPGTGKKATAPATSGGFTAKNLPLQGDDISMLLGTARIKVAMGRFQEAYIDLLSAQLIDPENPELRNEMQRVEAQLRQRGEDLPTLPKEAALLQKMKKENMAREAAAPPGAAPAVSAETKPGTLPGPRRSSLPSLPPILDLPASDTASTAQPERLQEGGGTQEQDALRPTVTSTASDGTEKAASDPSLVPEASASSKEVPPVVASAPVEKESPPSPEEKTPEPVKQETPPAVERISERTQREVSPPPKSIPEPVKKEAPASGGEQEVAKGDVPPSPGKAPEPAKQEMPPSAERGKEVAKGDLSPPPEKASQPVQEVAPSSGEAAPSPGATAHKAGDLYTEPVTGMVFRYVAEGCFTMGDNHGKKEEQPAHEVCLAPYWIASHEVSNGQYRLFDPGHKSWSVTSFLSSFNGDRQPVVAVSWGKARDFAKWLSGKNPHGHRFRLPSEAQWEQACRAGMPGALLSGGAESMAGAVAWYDGNSDRVTHEVGTKGPNGWGLYDFSGNVSEWVEDDYREDAYTTHPRDNPLLAEHPAGHGVVHRGGDWAAWPSKLHCAAREGTQPGFPTAGIGFRLLMEP